MSPTTFTQRLRRLGVTVQGRTGWTTHNRNHKGHWGPVHGIAFHHTVTRGSAARLCWEGTADLPGPLCHGNIDRDGVMHMIGWGRTNHAGLGDDDVLRAVIAERSALPAPNERNTDGNRHLYGFECDNRGDGKELWPRAQLDTMILVSYVLCRYHGWNQNSVLGHGEWTNQKVDPRGPIRKGGPSLKCADFMEEHRRGVAAMLRARKG